MICFKTARVERILASREGAVDVEVEIDGERFTALNYSDLTGAVEAGDRVIVNTTAIDLDLGTGGNHLILWNIDRSSFSRSEPGHLMKLRYTPLQIAGLSVEEPDSPYHDIMRESDRIDNHPVIVCGLHSQLLPAALTARAVKADARIAYIMTDGGALPAAFSRSAAWLKRNGIIEAVITSGQAFGGDFEAVNIYSALIAAKAVVGADLTIVAMGPGISGTGTPFGHTGMEQGQIINAVDSLGGKAIALLRLSQNDSRGRHAGISHHSISALSVAALAPAIVPVPIFEADLDEFDRQIRTELRDSGIIARHKVEFVDNNVTIPALREAEADPEVSVTTMGRGLNEEPAFFKAAGAGALLAF